MEIFQNQFDEEVELWNVIGKWGYAPLLKN
jgi:hypothetical protein